MYRQLLRDGYGISEVDGWEVEFFFSMMELEEEGQAPAHQVATIDDVF